MDNACLMPTHKHKFPTLCTDRNLLRKPGCEPPIGNLAYDNDLYLLVRLFNV